MPDPAMWRCCLLGLFAIRRSGLLAIRRYVTHSLRSMHSVYADAPRNSRPVSGQHNATRYTGPWASTRGVCSGAARILRGDAVTCHAHPGRQHRVNHGRTGGTSPTTLRITIRWSMLTRIRGRCPPDPRNLWRSNDGRSPDSQGQRQEDGTAGSGQP